ncbi:hypothetical protein OAD66_04185 [Bacteroidia bacterium]|nr:hypothetical protein [Bacteroidia bacterium]
MKLNKSIFGLVILAVFVVSSCSQARYGSHTRRTKSAEIVQADRKVRTVNKDTGMLSGEKVSDVEHNEDKSVVRNNGEAAGLLSTMMEQGALTNTKTLLEKKTIRKVNRINKVLNTIGESTAVSNLGNRVEVNVPSESASTNDETSDLLEIILIVILVLLILSLVTKLLPLLSWLLGVALLVLLIWLILQYI